MTSKLEELESLLFDWEAGSLGEQGVERVRELLRDDPLAQRHFLQLQLMTAAMQLETDAGLAPPHSDESTVTPLPVSPLPISLRPAPTGRAAFHKSLWLAGALSLVTCALTAWVVHSTTDERGTPTRLSKTGAADPTSEAGETSQGETRDASREATSRGIALVTRLVDVAWGDGQAELEVGDALPPGRFVMQTGHAQIEFFCGATVIVEGPAEIELASATLARVRSGRLRAHVPPAARGFSLEVDDLRVVDLGTEFGLSVSSEGASVQVFDGEVELRRESDPTRTLTAGQAVVRTAGGGYQDTATAPERFVDIAGLESLAEVQRSARFERWRARSGELRRDPRIIAYYALDQPGDWARRLTCGSEPASRELDGAIVGAAEVAGRWHGKRALEFKRPADRVRVQIPGEYGSLTLACWVKIDSLDRWYNSLFLTDGYDKGEPHWQILDTGQLYFSVRPLDREQQGVRDFKAVSPSFWKPSMVGKWLHLAVTCDLNSRTITHYTNGSVLSRHIVPDGQLPSATRFGAASIGNWATPTMPDAEFAIRNLNGSIDELAIIAAVLNAEEIKEMYEYGKP